jgi:magnesium chelatase family protein
MITQRPWRAPHHTASLAALCGGGSAYVVPGEVSLAHHGVLFLDDLIEFKPVGIDAMCRILAEGIAVVTRGTERLQYPARPLLVGGAPPCWCGFAGSTPVRCACAPERVESYRSRLVKLAPMFGIHAHLSPFDPTTAGPPGESSAVVRARVIAARQVQADRAWKLHMSTVNGALTPRELERVAQPDEAGARILGAAVERLGLNAHAYGHVLRIARTIADLDGSDAVRAPHVAEAVAGRLFGSGLICWILA